MTCNRRRYTHMILDLCMAMTTAMFMKNAIDINWQGIREIGEYSAVKLGVIPK